MTAVIARASEDPQSSRGRQLYFTHEAHPADPLYPWLYLRANVQWRNPNVVRVFDRTTRLGATSSKAGDQG